MRKLVKEHPVIGVYTLDPNLTWLVRQLGKSENYPVEILNQLKNFRDSGRFALMVIDLDCLKSDEEASSVIGGIHREMPGSRVIALTSASNLCDALCEEGVEHVFLKPVLSEHLYNSILNAMKHRSIASSRETKSQHNKARSRAKILVVDDELEVCEFLKDALEETEEGDFEVRFAQDPEAAVRGCAEFEPDFVIVDLKLPQMSGVELIERFKRFSGSKPKDYLIFTGSDHAEHTKRIQSLGYAYLPKRSDLKEIIDAVVQLCHKWRLVGKAA